MGHKIIKSPILEYLKNMGQSGDKVMLVMIDRAKYDSHIICGEEIICYCPSQLMSRAWNYVEKLKKSIFSDNLHENNSVRFRRQFM